MLFKEIVDARTHARTMDNGPSQKLTLSTLCSGELKTLASFKMQILILFTDLSLKILQNKTRGLKGHSGAIYRGPLMLSTKYW